MERVPLQESMERQPDWRAEREAAMDAVEAELAARLEGLAVAGTHERIEALRDMVTVYGETVPGTQLPVDNALRFHAEYAAQLLKEEEEAALAVGDVSADDFGLQFQLRERRLAELMAYAANDDRAEAMRVQRDERDAA